MITDDVMKEFAQEVLAFQSTCDIPNDVFAGMLMGATVLVTKRTEINKGQFIALCARQWDIESGKEDTVNGKS